MGLLDLGTPLPWEEAKQYTDYVRHHGITQFLHIWDIAKDRTGDEFLWGDEVEYMVITFDSKERNAKLSLRQNETLVKLGETLKVLSSDSPDSVSIAQFHHEYGNFMLESIPGSPYTGSIVDLLSVGSNMSYRRALARKHLKDNEIPVTLTSFPRLGTPGVFAEPHYSPEDTKSSHSLFLPEEAIIPHPRYPTLTANIRKRRGSKVAVNVPLFIDKRTPRPFVDPTIPWQRDIYPEDAEAKNGAALMDHIYMDAMGFAAARQMYDALIPISPLMLALSAASPIWRGYLSDVDCRWNVIAGGVDDRTPEERGLVPLKTDKYVIPKSRWDSVDMYISPEWINKPAYNDIVVPYDEAIYNRLLSHGLDKLLSKHVAHLFIRDPLVMFSESIHQDDTSSNAHFESIQSTNWQTVRFKPPSPNSPIGWRVELRSLEVQITDFENAAFAVFTVLLSRAILAFSLNFYIPISKVDENMARAQKRDAARAGKFFFRKNVFPSGQGTPATSSRSSTVNEDGTGTQTKTRNMRNRFPPPTRPSIVEDVAVEDEYEEMSIQEIFCGKDSNFPGLLGLVDAYLATLETTPDEKKQIDKYLNLIRCRANGTLQTSATWMRNFVRSHPAYKFDSVVNQEINYDLLRTIDDVERGVLHVCELLPDDYNPQHINVLC